MSDELFDLLGLDSDDAEVVAASDDDANLAHFMRCLHLLREQRKLGQKDVARLMGTTQSAVSDLERTAVDPRISTLQRYARAVGAALKLVAVPVDREWNGDARFVARTRVPAVAHERRTRPRLRVVVHNNAESESLGA